MKMKICPKCGSTKTKIPPAGLDIKMTIQDYCADCRYRGTFPEIEEKDLKKLQKKIKSKKK